MRKQFSENSPCRIVLIDDHPIFRQGLAHLIAAETDCRVCGEASDAGGAFRLVAEHDPNLLIIDITLRDASGIDVLKKLRALHPDLQALVVSMHDESLYAERAIRAGALGYVMKQSSPEVVLKAIRRVLDGDRYLSPKVNERILSLDPRESADASQPALGLLTDRELQIFEQIGHGKSVREIATELDLSSKTVESHRTKVREKLRLKNAAELVRYSMQWVQKF